MKKGFSLIEFIFVVVIACTLFKIYSPNFTKNQLLAGAKQILNDIKYARSLAMLNSELKAYELSTTKKDKEYFQTRWQLFFTTSKFSNDTLTYSLFYDKNADSNANVSKKHPKKSETAQSLSDPTKLMISGQSGVLRNDNILASAIHNIELRYGITKVLLRGACDNNKGLGAKKLVFASNAHLLGRSSSAVRLGSTQLLTKEGPCVVVLRSKDLQSVCIEIDTLTSDAYIPEFKNSLQKVHLGTQKINCDDII